VVEPKVIDGRAVAAGLRSRVADVATRVRDEMSLTAGLAAVLVGNNPASQVYVRAKGRACAGSCRGTFSSATQHSEIGRDDLEAGALLAFFVLPFSRLNAAFYEDQRAFF